MDLSNFDEQVKALQAALSQIKKPTAVFKSNLELLALALAEGDEAQIVSLASVDGTPDWLWELLHPKGLDGKFIKKGSASYVYGHAKKATFKPKVSAYDANKNPSSATPKDVTLEPGESLWQTGNGTVTWIQNEHGAAKFWNKQSKTWSNWTNPPGNHASWSEYSALNPDNQIKKIDDNPPEASVHAESLADAEKAVKATTGWTDVPASSTPDYVFAWSKTKVMDALHEKTSKKIANYLYAQSSFYNPKTEGDSADNAKSYAQRDALTRLANAYSDSGELNDPYSAGQVYAGFVHQNSPSMLGSITPESASAMADAMDSLADYIESQTTYAELVDNVLPLKVAGKSYEEIDAGTGTKKTVLPTEYLRDYAAGYREAAAGYAPDAPQTTPEPAKASEAGLDVSKAVETPDVPNVKPADTAVVTTKAGPPYGPNVWFAPEYTDADGNPFIFSSQGEKNAYAVFAPGTPPATVTNSKGEQFEGVSNSGLLHEAVNKKSAKAWLVQNHSQDTKTVAETPVEEIVNPPAPAPQSFFHAVASSADLGPYQTAFDYLHDNHSLWVTTDDQNNIVGAIKVYSDGSAMGLNTDGSADPDSIYSDSEVQDMFNDQSVGLKKVVVDPTLAPVVPQNATVEEAAADAASSAAAKTESPSVTVKFTKTAKYDDGTIQWKVLGAKDEYGEDYSVTSKAGKFEVLNSLAVLLSTHDSAKGAKAWIAEQSADETAAPEEIPATENLPDFALGAKILPASLAEDVKALKTGDVKKAKYLTVFESGDGDPITYGVDESGTVVASSTSFQSALTGDNISEQFTDSHQHDSFGMYFAGANPLYVEPEPLPELPENLSSYPVKEFTVPPLPFGNNADVEFYAHGVGKDGTGLQHYVGLNAQGEIVAASHGMLASSLNLELKDLPGFDWTVNPLPKDKVEWGALPYPEDTPEWVKDEGIGYIPSQWGGFPYGSVYSVGLKDGTIMAVDSEGFVTSPASKKGNAAYLFYGNDVSVYYGAVGKTQPNPFPTPVADVSMPHTPQDEADGLPVEMESPSETNPTPGDPKAHLAVPVTGYKNADGLTIPGVYETKKMKDENGDPYILSAAGPNSWEVYTSAGYHSSEKPLSTHKQLKQAKAWLANGGAASDGALVQDGPSGEGKFYMVGKSAFYAPPGAQVWHNEDTDTYYVNNPVSSSIFVVSASSSNYMEKKHFSTPKKIKDMGLKSVFGGAGGAKKPADYWADYGDVSNLPKPKEKYAPVTGYWGSDAYNVAKNGDIIWTDVATAASSVVPNKSWSSVVDPMTPEELQSAAKAAYDKAMEYDWKGFIEYIEKRRAEASGAEKTKWSKALGRAQTGLMVAKILGKISDGTVSGSDYVALTQSYGDSHHMGSLTLPYAMDTMNSFGIKMSKKAYFKDQATVLGIDPEKVLDGEVDWSAEEVEQWKNKFAAEFHSAIAYMDDSQVKALGYRLVVGDNAQISNMITQAQKQILVAQSVQMAKDWIAAKKAGETPPALTEAQKDNIPLNIDLQGGVVLNALKGADAPEVEYDGKTYGYGMFSGKWVNLADSSAPSIGTNQMGFLIKSGMATPKSGDVELVPTTALKWIAYGDDTPAVWNPAGPEMAQIVTPSGGSSNNLYGFIDGGNPLILSQVGGASNPFTYADTDLAWKALNAKVEAEMPDLLAGDIDAYPYSKYVEVFGLANAYGNVPDAPFTGAQYMKQWIKDTIVPKLNAASTASLPAHKEFTSFAKPADLNVSDDVWAMATAAANGVDLPVYEDTKVTAQWGKESMSGTIDLALTEAGSGALDNVPESYQKFYTAAHNNKIANVNYSTVDKITAAVMKTGIWTSEDQKNTVEIEIGDKKLPVDVYPGDVIWKGENDWGGSQVYIHKANGSVYGLESVYDYDSGQYKGKIVTGTAYNYFTDGVPSPGSAGLTNWKEVYVSPVDFTHEFVSEKIGSSKESFDIFDLGFLSGSKAWGDVSLPQFGSVQQGDSLIHMKKFLADTDDEDWKAVAKFWGEISPAGKKTLHWAQANGNTDIPKMANLAKKYGMFAPGAEASPISKDAPYYDNVTKGLVSVADIADKWSGEHEQQAAHDLLGVSFEDYWKNLVKYRKDLSDALTGKTSGGSAEKKHTPASMADTLVLHPASFSLGGMHSKGTWADEDGNKWLSKAFSSDPNSLARIEAEHYAMRIGALFGYNPPATGIMKTPDGKTSYVQHYADAAGDLSGWNYSSLAEGALHSAMEQHVFDWVISNHDSHGGNILRTVDGSSTYPIDRGQAFKFLGKDKLAVGYLPPGNGEAVWYDHVYNAIKTNAISKEKADAIRDAVLRKAAIVTARNDEEYRDYVTKALEHRTSLPGSFSTTSEMVDYLMKRKASTFDDFAKFYESIYKSAGYDFGTHTLDDYLPKKVGEAHVAITPDLVEDVLKSNSVGVPVFFGGTELDNGHMQMFTTNNGADKTLRMHAMLTTDADNVLQQWLSKQTIEKQTGGGYSPYSAPVPAGPSHSVLPGLVTSHNHLVNFVKTVGSHIKSGDYAWNANTVNEAETAMNLLESSIDAVKKHIEVDPVHPYAGQVMSNYSDDTFVTVEQQDAWLSQAEKMLENFQIVKNAMDTKVSVSQTHPDLVPFTQPTYTPSTTINKEKDKVKTVGVYEYDGKSYTKYDNGAYTVDSGTGEKKSTAAEYLEAVALGEKNSTPETMKAEAEAAQPDETEVTVSAGTQIIKVTYRHPKSYTGHLDKNTLEVTETGQENGSGLHGMEYLIEVDGIKMQFQSAKDVSIKSQQGVLRMEIAKWTGDTQQIEKALTALRSMGLELNEANETELELLYWRQLRGTLNKRKLDAKWKSVQKELASVSTAMNPAEELAAYRAAFSKGYGADVIDNFTQRRGWLPQVGKYAVGDGTASNGRPWWYRPDIDIQKLKTAHNGRLLRHSIGDYDAHESMGKLGFLPTEERLRVLGRWIDGMSSGEDQSKGSSEYLFFRQNTALTNSSLYLEPIEFFRTSNYGFTSDSYGSAAKKATTSPFDVWSTTSYSDSDNETMVKNGISLMDGMAVIVVHGEDVRQKIIDHYKNMGVTEIRGIPVAERVVTNTSAAQATINKVWDYWINKEKNGEDLWATA